LLRAVAAWRIGCGKEMTTAHPPSQASHYQMALYNPQSKKLNSGKLKHKAW